MGSFAWVFVAAALGADPDYSHLGVPIPPKQSVSHMTLPEGFAATLYAGEPDVVQPIAMTVDPRGRLWVVECLSYPDWQSATPADRVTIFEDADGDGRFDDKKTFLENGRNLTGIALGFGGVWLCSTPELVFIPDRDGDDKPDGPPQVVLDGWNLGGKHNVFNGLTWGPDGWLYGCHGILSLSRVGKPGATDAERTPLDCGVWRYHPVREVFEVFAWGTTNPWGLDFDDYGQMFITNCVIEHLFHVFPGAHFKRMHSRDLNPNVYELMQTCADHIHWAGGDWQSSRGNTSDHDQQGGGHAHSGAMVYLGDNWPAEYRNAVFTCNIHGLRVNQDRLRRKRSGYAASHARDLLRSDDPWFRGLELKYGPDGGVYIIDWSDAGECHDYEHVDRVHGRIYKLTYGKAERVSVDLNDLPDLELAELQLHRNDWHVRTARRLLHERAADRGVSDKAVARLQQILTHRDATRRLRALWCLQCLGKVDEELVTSLLQDESPDVRAWAIRLGAEQDRVSQSLIKKLIAAASDPNPFVRVHLAAALQRLEPAARWSIADRLAANSEDSVDPQIPLMIWYGIESVVLDHPQQAARMVTSSQMPLVREFIARRIAVAAASSGGSEALNALFASLVEARPDTARDVLRGVHKAVRGVHGVKMPPKWPSVFARIRDSKLRDRAVMLGLIFGDATAAAALKATARDASLSPERRSEAVTALVQQQVPGLATFLQNLLTDDAVCQTALRGLAAYPHPNNAKRILEVYSSLTNEQKDEAVNTLAARADTAATLLKAIGAGQVPARDLSQFTARQMLGLGDEELNATLAKVWGTVRNPSKQKTQMLAALKKKLSEDVLLNADVATGRTVFQRNCATCHQLFGEGKKIGPDLTGSQRANLDYILENLLDPSAVVGRDHRMTMIATSDGRVVSGLIARETDQLLTLQTPTGEVLIPTSDVEQRKESNQSLMPDGLLDKLSDEQIRDLIGYLRLKARPSAE